MRKPSIDALRGLVVILMALDHAQFFWFSFGLPNDGLNGYVPAYVSTFHQLTRFLSHICAPTFLFLAGMMMAWTHSKKHLFIRGIILITLQFTLENIAWWPKDYLSHGYKYFGILSCIGFSMCFYSFLSGLNAYLILIFSITLFLISQCIHPMVPHASATLQVLAILFYAPTLEKTYPMTSLFTIIQWMGFMGMGLAIGKIFQNQDLYSLKNKFFIFSLLLIITAFILRTLNGFGNFIHWYGPPLGSDFFIISKYPPSLVFTLLTLGIMFFIWALLIQYEEKLSYRIFSPFIIFGQTSLFFYISHLYLYGSGAYMYGHPLQLNLYQTWGVWFLGLIPLYFLCLLYKKMKFCYPNSWLRYI